MAAPFYTPILESAQFFFFCNGLLTRIFNMLIVTSCYQLVISEEILFSDLVQLLLDNEFLC